MKGFVFQLHTKLKLLCMYMTEKLYIYINPARKVLFFKLKLVFNTNIIILTVMFNAI